MSDSISDVTCTRCGHDGAPRRVPIPNAGPPLLGLGLTGTGAIAWLLHAATGIDGLDAFIGVAAVTFFGSFFVLAALKISVCTRCGCGDLIPSDTPRASRLRREVRS